MLIIQEYTADEMDGIKSLEEEVEMKFLILLQVIFKENKIPLKYLKTINSIAHDIVQRIPPNAIITNNMNICENLRFKCFLS